MDKNTIVAQLHRVKEKKDPLDVLFLKSLHKKIDDALQKGRDAYDLTGEWVARLRDLSVTDKIDGPKGTLLRLLTTKDGKHFIFNDRRCLHTSDDDEVWTEIKARMVTSDEQHNDEGSAGASPNPQKGHAHDKKLSRTNTYGKDGEPYIDMDPARRMPMLMYTDETRGGNAPDLNTPGRITQLYGAAQDQTRTATRFLKDNPFISVIGMPGGCKAHVAETLALFYGLPLYTPTSLMAESGARNTRVARALSDAILRDKTIPDGMVAEAVAEYINTLDGAVLLDYPYTVQQLWGLPLTIMANIEADIEKVGTHIAGTRWCSTCFNAYHIKCRPPVHAGLCDRCGHQIILRPDHTLPTTRKAYSSYVNDRSGVVDYARDLNTLIDFGADQSPIDVARAVDRLLLRPQDEEALVADGRVLDKA